jgi:death on curing protein
MKKWQWVERAAVMAAHDRLLVDYGGSEGVLSLDGLDGALGRPQNLAAYGAPEPDIADLAAVYAVGIAKAHAFVDGNKRTAWATMRAFLRLNGYTFNFEKMAAVLLMEDVAKGNIDEVALTSWIRPKLVLVVQATNDDGLPK